jgi:uncharacterized protein YuzE
VAPRIDGYYDERADIAWLRSEDCDPAMVVSDETEFGVRELDPGDRYVVGVEYGRASERLPAELLRMLPSPRLVPKLSSAECGTGRDYDRQWGEVP